MARALPGRLAAQLHEPDGDALLGDLRGHADRPQSSASATPCRTRRAQLAELVGVPFEEITFLGAGINHQAFILRFERDGENLYPLLDDAIARDPELPARVRVEMYRRLGYFPTESSEHTAEYLPWFMQHDELIERFRISVDEYVQRSEENLDEYERIRAALARGEGLELERSTSTRR